MAKNFGKQHYFYTRMLNGYICLVRYTLCDILINVDVCSMEKDSMFRIDFGINVQCSCTSATFSWLRILELYFFWFYRRRWSHLPIIVCQRYYGTIRKVSKNPIQGIRVLCAVVCCVCMYFIPANGSTDSIDGTWLKFV